MKKTAAEKLILALFMAAAIVFSTVPSVLAERGGYGPGRIGLKILEGRDHVGAGNGGIWNSRDKLHIQLDPTDGWRIKGYHVDLGGGEDYMPPLTTTGNPKIGHFDYKDEFSLPYVNEANEDGSPFRRTLVLDLAEDLGFQWGAPFAELRIQGVAIFLELVKLDDAGNVIGESGAWVVPELITWIVDEEETGETEVVVGDDATVADEETGELIDTEATEVKQTDDGKVAKVEHQEAQKNWEVDEAEELIAFDGGRWGWWFSYEMAHPKTGHFIDSPVAGLHVETPTYEGVTDINAAFNYFPGEEVDIAIGSVLLGSALADHKISPLDIFVQADTTDPQVINMARLLQSLDVDGDPQGGIVITEQVAGAFEQGMGTLGLTSIDFRNDEQVEAIIQETIYWAGEQEPPIILEAVSYEDAKIHLEATLNNVMFRKNVSNTLGQASTKAKLAVSTTWFPALPANAHKGTEALEIEYRDENAQLIRTRNEAKPIIVTYTDDHPVTGAPETWAAVSRDDGKTWKRKNLSRSADRSSFTLANGQPYYGAVKKPVVQFRGNKIIVAWSSKFCRGGKPRYAIDIADDYSYDDPYYTEDIWGVAGPQRSYDYTGLGHPEVGELPFSSVWIARGVIATLADVNAGLGEFVGDIVWFKPERLTSGRRDALQIFMGGASGAGFSLVWQEDPKGVRPGKFAGPGHGWSGATTNHKTDIWYSYITWADFAMVDDNFVIGGDPEHDVDAADAADPDDTSFTGRPKALVPMSLPVRLSDNDVVNMKNIGLDTTTAAEDVAYLPEALTRCVKFEGGKSIVEVDSPDASKSDYAALNTMPEDHLPSMNCTNCHVPFGTTPMGLFPTQGAPVPLVVVDAASMDYLGGFTNSDCVSCHFSHVVPRDRVIALDAGLDLDGGETAKYEECEDKGGIWKADVEAYYPYEGYPYLVNEDDVNDGTRRYATEVDGLLSGEYHTFTSFGGHETSVAITTDGRLLDGDTGASRANLFLQPKFDADLKVVGAWAIINYEETKGAGNGPPDHDADPTTYSEAYLPEQGKNIIYHSFEFNNPDLVSGGTIVNLPERDEFGNVMYITESEGGTRILDYEGQPQLAYENARRARFILQGDGAIKASRTVMLMVYKEGKEGTGRPSDIMLRRFVVPTTDDRMLDNPYRVDNLVGTIATSEGGKPYYADGAVNISTVTPDVTTDSAGDPEQEDPYGAVKVVSWRQTPENLEGLSSVNPYEDARSHRGQIRGDFATVGYAYTPNWAAARNGNDKYDFFIRRTFDGGLTWTTDPAGSGVEHCKTWTTPTGMEEPGTKEEVCTFYAAGTFEEARNVSQLPNAKSSVIEPRIVATPGTIKVAGVWTGIAEDKQDANVYYVAYGTASNPKKEWDPVTGEMVQEDGAPEDLFLSFSPDKGESYWLDEWVVNPDSDGTNAGETVTGWKSLAKGDPEQGEVQIRMTPDGSRFYGCWLDEWGEGNGGSDIFFRRIMPSAFSANVP